MRQDQTNPEAALSKKNVEQVKAILVKYQQPSLSRALWQLSSTFGLYLLAWFFICLILPLSVWRAIPIMIFAAGLQLRIFIIFHDCGHGSFFKSKRANDMVGFIAGIITLTPYYNWRWEHSLHHATSGKLDRRGQGDLWMMTVQEYLRSSRWKKLSYRIVRNPLTLLLVAPLLIFVVEQRFPSPAKKGSKERRSVTWMNLALLVVWMLMSVVLGLKRFLSIELPLVALSGAIGIWLFYVQHQFQEAYWEHEGHWNYEDAAWEGSSYYKLPKLFQWFTGNIGFHHIHHLSSRIPNYNLERCHNELKSFHKIEAMTLWSSLKSLRLRLWDEKIKKLVSFRQLKNAKRDAIS